MVLAQSIRPQLVLLPWALYAVVIVKSQGFALVPLLLGFGLMVAAYGVVVIQNDLADEAIDISNRRTDIPLAAGRVSADALARLGLLLTATAMTFGLILGHGILLWVTVYAFLGWMYSGTFDLKGRGVLGLAVLGVCYGFMPWVLGFLVAHVSPGWLDWGLAFTSLIFAAGITALKDFKDEVGDRLGGKRTFLVRYGAQLNLRYALVATTAAYCAAVGLLAASGQYTAVVIGIGLTVYSGWKLADGRMATSPRFRGRYGGRVRTAFYVLIGSGYLAANGG